MDLSASLRDSIIGMLGESRGVRFAVREVQEQTGGNLNTVRRTLAGLASEGIIGRIKSKGSRAFLYFVTDDRLEDGLYEFSISESDQLSDQSIDHLGDQSHKVDGGYPSAPIDLLITKEEENSPPSKNSPGSDQWINSPHEVATVYPSAIDHPIDHIDQGGDQLINNLSIGERVIYTGEDKGKQRVCGQKHLEVLEIKGSIAVPGRFQNGFDLAKYLEPPRARIPQQKVKSQHR